MDCLHLEACNEKPKVFSQKFFFVNFSRLNPEDQTPSAQRQNQFRKYFGYHPAEQQSPLSLDYTKQPQPHRGQISQNQHQEPASLPLFLENLPPPPPIRTNTLSKGLPINFRHFFLLLVTVLSIFEHVFQAESSFRLQVIMI